MHFYWEWCIIPPGTRAWLSLVERVLWEHEAAGSNPVARTKKTRHPNGVSCLFAFGKDRIRTHFNGTVRWTVPCRRLDGGNTKMKPNPVAGRILSQRGVLCFCVWKEQDSNPIQWDSPVDCPLPPAGRRQHLYFLPSGKKMQTSLATRTKTASFHYENWRGGNICRILSISAICYFSYLYCFGKIYHSSPFYSSWMVVLVVLHQVSQAYSGFVLQLFPPAVVLFS